MHSFGMRSTGGDVGIQNFSTQSYTSRNGYSVDSITIGSPRNRTHRKCLFTRVPGLQYLLDPTYTGESNHLTRTPKTCSLSGWQLSLQLCAQKKLLGVWSVHCYRLQPSFMAVTSKETLATYEPVTSVFTREFQSGLSTARLV